MITKEMFEEAYDKHIVTLTSPRDYFNDDNQPADATIGCIGEYWFYFGGQKAENMSPAQYALEIDRQTIIDEMFEVIDDFKNYEDTKDEYAYYEAIFAENGIEDK